MQRELQVIELLLGRQGLSWSRLQEEARLEARLEAFDQQEQPMQQPRGVLLPKPDAGRTYGLSGLGSPKVCS